MAPEREQTLPLVVPVRRTVGGVGGEDKRADDRLSRRWLKCLGLDRPRCQEIEQERAQSHGQESWSMMFHQNVSIQ
jgi:hypothetical protein